MTEVSFTPEQQALVDKLVGDARIKAREVATREMTEQQEAAQEQSLKDSAKWEELSRKHEARISELEAVETKLKAYDEFIEKMLSDVVGNFDKRMKAVYETLPEGMDNLQKLAFINSAESILREPEEEAKGDGVGTPHRQEGKANKPALDGNISSHPIRF